MAGDKIMLLGAHYSAYLGIPKKEKQFVQPVIMDIVVELRAGISSAAKSDDIGSTLNYSSINKLIQELLDANEFHLIETLAEAVIAVIQNNFKGIEQIDLLVKKPQAMKNVDYAAVSISRR